VVGVLVGPVAAFASPPVSEVRDLPNVLSFASPEGRASAPVADGGQSPAISRTLAKKARLRGVLIPQSTGGDW